MREVKPTFIEAFLAAGAVPVVGTVAYVVLVGRLDPIADPPWCRTD